MSEKKVEKLLTPATYEAQINSGNRKNLYFKAATVKYHSSFIAPRNNSIFLSFSNCFKIREITTLVVPNSLAKF